MTGEWAWEVLFWPCSLFRSSLNSCLLLCWRSLLKIVFILMVYTISATLYSVQVALGLNWPLSPSFRPKISYFENKMCVLFISIIKTAMVKYQASEFALWIQTHFNKQPETICLASSCISTMTIKGWNISTVFPGLTFCEIQRDLQGCRFLKTFNCRQKYSAAKYYSFYRTLGQQ